MVIGIPCQRTRAVYKEIAAVAEAKFIHIGFLGFKGGRKAPGRGFTSAGDFGVSGGSEGETGFAWLLGW